MHPNRPEQPNQPPMPRETGVKRCLAKLKSFSAGTTGLWFIIKTIVMSVFKISNLSILLQRFITIALVLAHYQFIEKVPYINEVDVEKGALR